jgi:hypothetical protein
MARKIEIEVTGDTRGLERALSRAQGSSKRSFDKIAKTAKYAGLAIAGGLAVAAKFGFDELQEGQRVAAQTAAVLKSTGGAAKVTAKEIEALATSLSKMSGVDDEAIQSSENLLLTFKNVQNQAGKGNKIFDQATKAILDMSVAMGTDLNSATIQVGKALNDPIKGITALTRVGVTFSDQQKKTIARLVETGKTAKAQKLILAELRSEFAGSARAAGETLSGQLNKARNAFAEIAAEILTDLLPAITQLGERLLQLTAFMREHPKLAKAMVLGLAALSAALLTASAAQIALNLAVLANPYVAAAAAAVALAAGIAYLVTKVDFFRKHWQLLLITLGVFPVVVATVVKAVVRNFDTIAGAFRKAYDFARRYILPIASFFNPIIRAVQTAVTWIHQLVGAINSIHMPSLGGIGNAILPGNPFRGQHGGIVTRPTLSLIGERGPEAVVPLHRAPGASSLPRGGGMGEVRVIVVGGDAQAISYFTGLNARHARGNGGRSIW